MSELEELPQGDSPGEKQHDLSRVIIELGSGGRDSWTIEGELPAEKLIELANEAPPTAPALVDLIITREKKLWRVRGDLETEVELSCSRCLNHYRLRLLMTIDRYVSSGQDPALDAGMTEMEEDVVYLEEGQFSPLRFAEEEFILVLPMIPICDDSCLGLCQNCGADKNSEPCSCPGVENENPFAILGQIKLE
jgi:uncharacterized protein